MRSKYICIHICQKYQPEYIFIWSNNFNMNTLLFVFEPENRIVHTHVQSIIANFFLVMTG